MWTSSRAVLSCMQAGGVGTTRPRGGKGSARRSRASCSVLLAAWALSAMASAQAQGDGNASAPPTATTQARSESAEPAALGDETATLDSAESQDTAATTPTKTEPGEAEVAADEHLGSQKDDRGPIKRGFGNRWIAAPTISSNPKLSTAFGAIGIVFLRVDDSVASQLTLGGNFSVSESWTAFAFANVNFKHDRERIAGGIFRGHAANSYSNFMGEGIALESVSNVLATPLFYFHRLGERSKTDWWAGGQLLYMKMDQSGEDPTSSELISSLGLDGGQALSLGPNVLFDSRDNTNSPTKGQRLFVRGAFWSEIDSDDSSPVFGSLNLQYSYYIPTKYLVVALNTSSRFSWGAPLVFQSSLSQFRAYTVGEQIAENMMSIQAEARVPFGQSRFGASAFAGVATLFDDFSDWESEDTYNPMIGGGFRCTLSEQQKSIMRLEFAQGIGDARGVYIAMGQAFQ